MTMTTQRIPLALAADICGVKPGTIRRWVHDGHVTRYWDGYDYDELIGYRNNRSLAALAVRAGIDPRVVLAPPLISV